MWGLPAGRQESSAEGRGGAHALACSDFRLTVVHESRLWDRCAWEGAVRAFSSDNREKTLGARVAGAHGQGSTDLNRGLATDGGQGGPLLVCVVHAHVRFGLGRCVWAVRTACESSAAVAGRERRASG